MEKVENTVNELTNKNFIKHVFNFDKETQMCLLNIVQYLVLALIPISIYNRFVNNVIPEPNETKGSLEILAEVLAHLAAILVGIFFVHRVVTYLPTYSGKDYGNLNMFSIILLLLVIVYDIQGKVGMKMNFLLNRLSELWNGKQLIEGNTNKKPNVQVQSNALRIPDPARHAPSRADYVNTHEQMNPGANKMQNAVRNSLGTPQEPSATSQGNYQQSPGYNGLVDAKEPGQEMFEPMAANAALGGGFGSSW
jgi:hypothetical protein|tara:strand:- start:244 stop:996 length:753 start_codon:yes stop_codon:yes gene_type:complete